MRRAPPGPDPLSEGPGGAQHARGGTSKGGAALGPRVPATIRRSTGTCGPERSGGKGGIPGQCEAQVPPGQDSQRQSLGGERSVEGERGSCVPEGTEVTPLNFLKFQSLRVECPKGTRAPLMKRWFRCPSNAASVATRSLRPGTRRGAAVRSSPRRFQGRAFRCARTRPPRA